MVATNPLKSFLLITLLPAFITITSALPNPNPIPTQRCTPSSPSCHSPGSKISSPTSPTLPAPTSSLAPLIVIDTSILAFSTILSPTSQILSPSPTSITTSPLSPENTNSPPPKSETGRGPPPISRQNNRNSKTHQIIVIALSVSLTLLFLGLALLGFLFIYRRKRTYSNGENGSIRKEESDSTDCFMRRVEVDSLVSGGSSRGGGRGGGSKSTTKSAGAVDGDVKGLGIGVVEHAEDIESTTTDETRRRHGQKWSFDRSEETLSMGSPRGEEEERGKWSFDGGEEDSISPVRKEECGGWSSVYCSDSIDTPTTATTAFSGIEDGEGEKKWSFEYSSQETLSSPVAEIPTTASCGKGEKRDQWKEEEKRRSTEIAQDEKSNTRTLAPTKSHRSITSHIITPTPSPRFNTNTTAARSSLRVEISDVLFLLQTDDLISPLDLTTNHPSLNLSSTTSTCTSSPQTHENVAPRYGGEKMERSSNHLPRPSRVTPSNKRHNSLLPIQKAQTFPTLTTHHHAQLANHQYGNQENELKDFEKCVGSPPRQKESGFWSLGDCVDGDEVVRIGKIGKRRGGEDLWDYFITL